MAQRPATKRRVPRRRGPKPQTLLAYVRLTEALIAWRKLRGLRQAELAEQIGRQQSFVTKYETRKRRLDFVEVVGILDALGIGLDEAARVVRRR
jgi:transcriptional regulator with XRE-family HTH domain